MAALDGLLRAMELAVGSEPAVEQALWRYKQSGAPDFADCLHVVLVRQADRGPMWTFDERASRLDGMRFVGGLS